MIAGSEKGVKNYYIKKAVAYNRVFDQASPFTKEVLKDLAKFCRAHETTFNPDPRVHAALEGRREVFLRIVEFLKLDIEELYLLHKVKDLNAK